MYACDIHKIHIIHERENKLSISSSSCGLLFLSLTRIHCTSFSNVELIALFSACGNYRPEFKSQKKEKIACNASSLFRVFIQS